MVLCRVLGGSTLWILDILRRGGLGGPVVWCDVVLCCAAVMIWAVGPDRLSSRFIYLEG